MVLQDSFKYTIITVTVTLHCLSQPAVPPLKSTNHKWLQIRSSFHAVGNTPQGVEQTGPLARNVCAGMFKTELRTYTAIGGKTGELSAL